MPVPSRLADRLRSARPAIGIAVLVAVAAVLLNVAVARQLVGIAGDAQALAERWIARSATLAGFEEGARAFRQTEARLALAAAPTVRDSLRRLLDTEIRRGDSAIGALAGLSTDADGFTRIIELRGRWQQYVRRHRDARDLPAGEGSAALTAFRERESAYAEVIGSARRWQSALRSGAGQLAVRSRRSTNTSAALLVGSVVLTLGALAMTELVRRSANARASAERRWRELTEQRLGLVWELDAAGRVRFASAAAIDVLGEQGAPLVGRRALALVHPDDRRALARTISEAVRTGRPFRDVEVRVLRADGSAAWLAIEGQALRNHTGQPTGVRGLAVDVTRRTQAEHALEQGRRLEALGTLAGGVAHDLNNVFAAITGYAQLMRLQAPGGSASADDLAAIEGAADRGATLVRRILQFARKQPTERTAVSLRAIVEEVVLLLRPQLPPAVSITTDLATDAAYVLADPAELHQVVVNIAANAVHAMRRRGGVLHITLTVRGDAVELVMRDEGEGMSPAVLERAVEPFFTTRPTGEGTGMGLAVAHGVVHGLGGTLALASREQVGTTVRVTLPHHRPGRDDATTTRSTPTGLAPRRVLVLDDDQLVLRTMTRILERAGHQVTGYTEPRTALMALVTDPGCADVIVTDLTMPGMTGLEFLAALRRADVRTPAIMCSGYLDEETARRARLLGVVQLFDKPVPHDQLVRAVESVGTPVAATG